MNSLHFELRVLNHVAILTLQASGARARVVNRPLRTRLTIKLSQRSRNRIACGRVRVHVTGEVNLEANAMAKRKVTNERLVKVFRLLKSIPAVARRVSLSYNQTARRLNALGVIDTKTKYASK